MRQSLIGVYLRYADLQVGIMPSPVVRTRTGRHLEQMRELERGVVVARKRELIEPNPGDKRFLRRDEEGRFKEADDVGASAAQDQRRDAETEAKRGQGDRGDRGDE